MYSRGPVASAAPHLYAYFCLPEPAPPAAAPMSSFIVLATSMLGMAGADGDDDWAPAELDPAATAAGLGMPGNCFFLLLAPATPPAMVCLGVAGANNRKKQFPGMPKPCLLYTSPSPRDKRQSRMPSSA